MRRAAIAAALAALALCAPPAQAKAPKPADLPSVEEIYNQAKELKRLADEAKNAQAKDPYRETIETYRTGKVALDQYQGVVTILNEMKDDKVQDYRPLAADALIARFQKEEESDPQARAIRREIALKILNLMVAPKGDAGLAAIERILYVWYKAKMQFDIKFKASDSPSDRKRARDKMTKYLDKEDK